MGVSTAAVVSWLGAKAGAVAAVAGATATAYSANEQRQAAKAATSRANNALQSQAEADTRSFQSSNARLAARRKALAGSSLATGGGDLMSTGILNGGKPLLGG